MHRRNSDEKKKAHLAAETVMHQPDFFFWGGAGMTRLLPKKTQTSDGFTFILCCLFFQKKKAARQLRSRGLDRFLRPQKRSVHDSHPPTIEPPQSGTGRGCMRGSKDDQRATARAFVTLVPLFKKKSCFREQRGSGCTANS